MSSEVRGRNVDRNRNALLSGHGQSSTAAMGAAYNSQFMERENDEHINLLHSKVSQLKEMTIQIGDFVSQDNRLLDDMGGNFDRTGSLLGGTMKRLDALAQTKDGRHMIYLGLFVLCVFVILYLSSRR